MVVDSLGLDSHKTKALYPWLDVLAEATDGEGERGTYLLIDTGVDDADTVVGTPAYNLRLASRGLPNVRAVSTEGVNVYALLRAQTVVITTSAIERLHQFLTRPIRPKLSAVSADDEATDA